MLSEAVNIPLRLLTFTCLVVPVINLAMSILHDDSIFIRTVSWLALYLKFITDRSVLYHIST